MLIRCPSCSSGHELAPDLLEEGRILRCAYCRDSWRHRAAVPALSPGATVPARPEIVAEARFSRPASAEPRRPAPRRPHRPLGGTAWARRRDPAFLARREEPAYVGRATHAGFAPLRAARRAAAGLAAAGLALATLGGGMAAVACKARLVAAFPPSQAVFAAIGLPVNLDGLGLGEIRSTVVAGDGPATLTLEGHITNLRPEVTAVPPLRIAVRDKSRRELYYWTAPAPKAQLAAGETVLFRSRLSAPPGDGQDLAVSFAESPVDPRAAARRHVAEMMPGDR